MVLIGLMPIVNAICFSQSRVRPRVRCDHEAVRRRGTSPDPHSARQPGDFCTTNPSTTGGKAVLILAHVAGMIDMVALPVWAGALLQHYRHSAPQAGITVTVFLLAAVLATAFLHHASTGCPGGRRSPPVFR